MFDYVSNEWTLKNDAELCAYLEQFQKAFCDKCDQMEDSCRKLSQNSEKAINSIRNLEVKLTSMSNRKFVDMKISEDNDTVVNRRNNLKRTIAVDTMEDVLKALKDAANSGIETIKSRNEVSEDLPPFIGSSSFNSTLYCVKVEVTSMKELNVKKEEALTPVVEKSTVLDENNLIDEVRNEVDEIRKESIPAPVIDLPNKELNELNKEIIDTKIQKPISVLESASQVAKNYSSSTPIIYDTTPSSSTDSAENSNTPVDPLSTDVEKNPFTDRLEHLFQSRLNMNIAPKLEVASRTQKDDVLTKNGVEEVNSDELNKKKIEVSSNAHELPVPKSRQSNLVNTIVEKEKPEIKKKGLFDSDSEEEEVFQQFSKVLQKIKVSSSMDPEKSVNTQTHEPHKVIRSEPAENKPANSGVSASDAGPSDNFIAIAKSRAKGPSRKPPARAVKVEIQTDSQKAVVPQMSTKETSTKQDELAAQVLAPKNTGKSQPVKSIFDSESDDDLFTSSSSSVKKEPSAQKAVEAPVHNQTKEMAARKQTRQAVKNIFESDSEEDLDLFRKKH